MPGLFVSPTPVPPGGSVDDVARASAAAAQAAADDAQDAADAAEADAAAAQGTASAAASAASAAQSDVDTHEADLANPHAVTKAQVSLSNVTDDAQLKRAAGDIHSFTNVTSPASNDEVLIERAGSSYAKGRATVQVVAGLSFSEWTAKSSIAANDKFAIDDSAASYARKVVTFSVVLDFVGHAYYSAKSPLALADEVRIEDSAASYVPKRAVLSDILNLPLHGYLAAKSTPLLADEMPIEDSASSWARKRITIQDALMLPVHSALSNKATPVLADEVPIEDSASSWARKRITLTQLQSVLGAGGGATGARDSLWDPPTTGSADDDEFTVDGFASGTWKIYTDTRPVTTPWTRDGGLDMTVTPAASHFRSGVVGSTLWLQMPTGGLICKQFAGALSTKEIWWFAASCLNDLHTPGNDYAMQLMFWLNAAGPIPDNENRIRVGIQAGGYAIASRIGGGVVSNTTETVTQIEHMYSGVGAVVNHGSNAAGNVNPFAFTRNGHVAFTTQGQTAQLNAATNWVGALISSGSPTYNFATGGLFFGLHFLRRQTVGAGIAPLHQT